MGLRILIDILGKKIPKGTPAKHKQQQNFREENMRIKKKI